MQAISAAVGKGPKRAAGTRTRHCGGSEAVGAQRAVRLPPPCCRQGPRPRPRFGSRACRPTVVPILLLCRSHWAGDASRTTRGQGWTTGRRALSSTLRLGAAPPLPRPHAAGNSRPDARHQRSRRHGPAASRAGAQTEPHGVETWRGTKTDKHGARLEHGLARPCLHVKKSKQQQNLLKTSKQQPQECGRYP